MTNSTKRSTSLNDAVSVGDARPASTRFGLISKVALGLWLIAVAAIVVLRSIASTVDFAMVNALTAGLSVLSWLFLVLALWGAKLPRVIWRMVFLLPIAGGLVFAGLFKLERLDGELRPKFGYRWAADVDLPYVKIETVSVADDSFQARSTDFPQYLGPQRNAVVSHIQLANDWESLPPKIAWKQSIGDGWSGFAVQGDVAITMEQRDDQEWVSAYSVVDGRLLWIYVIPGRHTNVLGGTGPRSTPTISGGRVFACSAVSQVVCLDFASGEKIWSHELLEMPQGEFELLVAWGRSASPLVVDQRVFVPIGGKPGSLKTLAALDASSGSLLWQSGEDQISYSSPTLTSIAGQPQILYTSEKLLAAYRPYDGQLLWSGEAPGSSNADANISQPIAVGDGRVLLTKGYGQGAKLFEIIRGESEQWIATELWSKAAALRTKFTSCVVRDGFVYGLSDGILECVNLENSERAWKNGRYRQGQLLLVGEHLLVTSESGEVVLVDASHEQFRQRARFQAIGDVTWNTAALSGNRLLIRNSDEAACVILPLASGTSETGG